MIRTKLTETNDLESINIVMLNKPSIGVWILAYSHGEYNYSNDTSECSRELHDIHFLPIDQIVKDQEENHDES